MIEKVHVIPYKRKISNVTVLLRRDFWWKSIAVLQRRINSASFDRENKASP